MSVESKLYSNRTMVTKQTDINPSVTGENMVVYLKILKYYTVFQYTRLGSYYPLQKKEKNNKNKIKTDTHKVAYKSAFNITI